MERIDTVVVGAGVVGLACARALAAQGREVLILEAESRFGSGTSSRNSEVIHAGLYYPPGSLKALLCVRGRGLLYGLCASRGIAHRRCGKLIVASGDAQRDRLEAIHRNALACGVADLEPVDRRQLQTLEPALRAEAALLSPSTGIIDSHALMLTLLGDAERGGATLATRTTLTGGRVMDGGIALRVGDDPPFELHARRVVNAAGLSAGRVAGSIEGLAPVHVPELRFAKGSYFTVAGRAPFDRLIYPIPDRAGLGIHLTLDLAGQARFGPDVEWLDAPDHQVDPARAAMFYEAIRDYWPALPDGALQPAYAGVRPKLHGPQEPAADFRIDGPGEHGVPGLVNLFGIESPGLTACLAIAEEVVARLGD